MPKAAAAQPSRQTMPGQYFGLPGITRWLEQQDTNYGINTALATTTQTPATGYVPFRTTDIVFCWMWSLALAQTYTAGTSTLTTSQEFPYNWVQAFQLAVSNLYDIIDVQSGYDLIIFNVLRPYRNTSANAGSLNDAYTSPVAFPYNPETNLVSSGSYTTASTSVLLKFQIPACAWFDEYFELDRNGQILAIFNRVPVSPFYMSGTARNVIPLITMAAGSVSNLDTGPVNIGAGTGTFTSTGAVNKWRRVGMYGTKVPQEMPMVFNWRYAWVSRRFALGAVSLVDIPLKSIINNGGGGQVLMMFFRFFDPAANAGLGANIALSNVLNAQLFYGSALQRFNDEPDQMQQRLFDQHNYRMPIGVWVWDLALDEDCMFTNARALNVYTTDVTAHFNFTGTLSTSAYVVVGVEYLTYVIDEPTMI